MLGFQSKENPHVAGIESASDVGHIAIGCFPMEIRKHFKETNLV